MLNTFMLLYNALKMSPISSSLIVKTDHANFYIVKKNSDNFSVYEGIDCSDINLKSIMNFFLNYKITFIRYISSYKASTLFNNKSRIVKHKRSNSI